MRRDFKVSKTRGTDISRFKLALPVESSLHFSISNPLVRNQDITALRRLSRPERGMDAVINLDGHTALHLIRERPAKGFGLVMVYCLAAALVLIWITAVFGSLVGY